MKNKTNRVGNRLYVTLRELPRFAGMTGVYSSELKGRRMGLSDGTLCLDDCIVRTTGGSRRPRPSLAPPWQEGEPEGCNQRQPQLD